MNLGNVINIVIVILAVWYFYLRFKPTKGLRNLNADDFRKELEQPGVQVLIDVREPAELKSGYIPGARNIPLSQLKSRLGEIPQGSNVFLYCKSGMRSQQAARVLQKNKYANLINLKGGISAWNGKLKK